MTSATSHPDVPVAPAASAQPWGGSSSWLALQSRFPAPGTWAAAPGSVLLPRNGGDQALTFPEVAEV